MSIQEQTTQWLRGQLRMRHRRLQEGEKAKFKLVRGDPESILAHDLPAAIDLIDRTLRKRPDEEPTAFQIHINEAQRLALIELLGKHPELLTEDAPLRWWDKHLAGLPQNEREYPNTLHGFCL